MQGILTSLAQADFPGVKFPALAAGFQAQSTAPSDASRDTADLPFTQMQGDFLVSERITLRPFVHELIEPGPLEPYGLIHQRADQRRGDFVTGYAGQVAVEVNPGLLNVA